MKKKIERAEFILKHLNELYPETPSPLNHRNNYELLIAVLLSAQCTDERVNKVTPILFRAAKTPKKMIKLDQETVYNIIRPCGLAPKKARAILELSDILVQKYR